MPAATGTSLCLKRKREYPRRTALILCFLCFLSLPILLLAAATVRLSADIPAGKTKAVRIRSLPKGATVAVRVESTGPLVVAFVDSKSLRNAPRPLFTGQVEKKLTFSVVIPETDHYFLVLDNRKGEEDRRVTIAVQAAGPPPEAPEQSF